MHRDHGNDRGSAGAVSASSQWASQPGKRTLSEAVTPIQAKAASEAPARAPDARGAAAPAGDGKPRPTMATLFGAPVGGGGAALPPDVRAKMEAAMGADFSAVRVHEDGRAEALGAVAFAEGTNLHFAPGRYDPHSPQGQELLGHELAHVVQQAQGRVQATAQAKGADINNDPSLEREADEGGARAARGNRRSSQATTLSAGAAMKQMVIQRMTLLPFAKADKDLTKFVDEKAGSMAGEVVKGQPTRKIGVHEKLVVVGHGNGFDLYSHFEANAKGLVKMNYTELAAYLAKHVLPDGYRGEMVIWSCSSARPWKHIPSIKPQLPTGRQDLLDMSFIKALEQALTSMNGKDYHPTIKGSVGFASLHKRWDEAEVYENEVLKSGGTKLPASQGFISTKQKAPEEFYATMRGGGRSYKSGSSEDEADTGSSEEVSEVSEDKLEALKDDAKQPIARRASSDDSESEVSEEESMEVEAPTRPQPTPTPAPTRAPRREVGYLVEPRTRGSIQDRLVRNQFGGNEQQFQDWKGSFK